MGLRSDTVWESEEEYQQSADRAKARGHEEIIHDDGTTIIKRWVSDDEGREDTESGV